MGSNPRFRSLYDFCRDRINLHLECRNRQCRHTAILSSGQVWRWGSIWRWSMALDGNVMDHFRCHKCGVRNPIPRPTEQGVTHMKFFPEGEGEWKRVIGKIRG